MDVDERRLCQPATGWKSVVWSTEKSAVVDVDRIFHDPLYNKKCSQISLEKMTFSIIQLVIIRADTKSTPC